MRNKLLHPEPAEKDQRCTGRTTAIALDLLARLLAKQGHHAYAKDHSAGTSGANALNAAVQRAILLLDLKHVECHVVFSPGGQYNGHVKAISKIWVED
jgi:hypothetical protein